MNSEVLKYEAGLARLEKDAKALKIRIDGLVRALRDNLDPMAKTERLPVEMISEQAFDLANWHAAYMEKLAEIQKAKELLGRG